MRRSLTRASLRLLPGPVGAAGAFDAMAERRQQQRHFLLLLCAAVIRCCCVRLLLRLGALAGALQLLVLASVPSAEGCRQKSCRAAASAVPLGGTRQRGYGMPPGKPCSR